jgi:hypothetical protein
MIWTFIKKYWQLFLLFAGGIVGFILFRRKDSSFIDDYKKIQETHAAEVAKIEAIRLKERQDLELNQQRLEATLSQVKKQYEERLQAFDAKKQAEVESIVKEHGNDPDELSKQLAAVTGFKIIPPQ